MYFIECIMCSPGSRQDPVARFCDHGNEPAGHMKGKKLPDQLRDYQFLKKVLAA